MSETMPEIGSGGRLYAIEDGGEPPAPAPRGKWPIFNALKPVDKGENTPKRGRFSANWREIGSTSAELAGIAAISCGFGWYSAGLGLISAGAGLLALGVAAGLDGPLFHRETRPPGNPER